MFNIFELACSRNVLMQILGSRTYNVWRNGLMSYANSEGPDQTVYHAV